MTTLIDEIRADQDPRTVCRFCAWLTDRTKGEQAEWASAMTDRSFTHSSLFRAAKKRGYPNGSSAVETHRKNAHEVRP